MVALFIDVFRYTLALFRGKNERERWLLLAGFYFLVSFLILPVK